MICAPSAVSRGGQERSSQRRFLARENADIDISLEAVNPHRIRLACFVLTRDRSNRRTYGGPLLLARCAGSHVGIFWSGRVEVSQSVFRSFGFDVRGTRAGSRRIVTPGTRRLHCVLNICRFLNFLALIRRHHAILCFIGCWDKSHLLLGRRQNYLIS